MLCNSALRTCPIAAHYVQPAKRNLAQWRISIVAPQHRPRRIAASASGSGDSSSDSDWRQAINPTADVNEMKDQLEQHKQAILRTPVAGYLTCLGVNPSTAMLLSYQYERMHPTAVREWKWRSNLDDKFYVFAEVCSDSVRWTREARMDRALAEAWACSPGFAAVALPLQEFVAALLFIKEQLHRQKRMPNSLIYFFQHYPKRAGALLVQNPQAFEQMAAPWLREKLGWDESALADAVLSCWAAEFFSFDTQQAQRSLDWLELELGFTRQHASQLLHLDLHLLARSTERLPEVAQEAMEITLGPWGISCKLATALIILRNKGLVPSIEHRTGAVVQTLQDTIGLKVDQVVQLALDGNLTECPTWYAGPPIDNLMHRMKHLLLVYGSWPAVADALTQHPEAFSCSWDEVKKLLRTNDQLNAWKEVLQMMRSEQSDEDDEFDSWNEDDPFDSWDQDDEFASSDEDDELSNS